MFDHRNRRTPLRERIALVIAPWLIAPERDTAGNIAPHLIVGCPFDSDADLTKLSDAHFDLALRTTCRTRTIAWPDAR